jgi:fructokinase
MQRFSSDNETPLVVSVGEVLWDQLPSGVHVPGGAPANVAAALRARGARATLVSRVGDDEEGRELIGVLMGCGVDVIGVQTDTLLPTGRVGVSLDAAGKPTFEIHENVAWDAIEATRRARELAASADAVCFGTLAQRTAQGRDAVTSIVKSAREGSLRLCDLNLREPFIDVEVVRASLGLANVARLNEEELAMIRAVDRLQGDETEALSRVLDAYSLDLIALTRGGRGSRLFTRDHSFDHPGLPVGVVDTVGAGDAFTAALIVGLLRGAPLEDINAAANRAAAAACTRAGGLGATHSPAKPSVDPFDHKGG